MPLSPEIEDLVVSYMPDSIPGEVWASHGEVVRARIRTVCPESIRNAKMLLTVGARLLGFAVDEYIEPTPSVLFSQATIEWFTACQVDSLVDSSRAEYRSALRKLAGIVSDIQPIRRSDPKSPYTPAEVARLLQIADAQGTANKRFRVRTAVSLGVGAGVSSAEMLRLRGRHVRRSDSGAVVLEIEEPAARTVVVAQRFEDTVWEAAERAGADGLVVGVREGSRNAINQMLSNNVRAAGPDERFDVDRMRTTWIVELLGSGLDPVTILEAAGLATLGSLDRYLQYVTRRSPDLPAASLRELYS